MLYQLAADDGTLLDAHFELHGSSIVFRSRGGTKGKNARNIDYTPALRLLMTRLASSGHAVQKAWVDSRPVQSIPLAERVILDSSDAGTPVAEQVSRMATRMQTIGREVTSRSAHGNSTRKIRLAVVDGADVRELIGFIKAVPSKKDVRSDERLPVSELAKVSAEHLWRSVALLLDGYNGHAFKESEDYDVLLPDGTRLAPKAVFGIALTEVIGYEAKPKHFTGGVNTPCFRAITAAGYQIVPKGEKVMVAATQELADQEWSEGSATLRKHLRRERAPGLREAKKAEFRRTHDGRLFCQRCQDDFVAQYGPHADACIEVHHRSVHVAEMQEGHKTRLNDLECLCANCHRVEHRLLKSPADSGSQPGVCAGS